MFIEASSPRRPGDKARLLSQYFDTMPANGMCVSFWYHMFGSAIGTLNVLWKTAPGNGSNAEQVIWRLKGQQQNKWLFARVTFPNLVKPMIVFEAIRGNSYAGDIAIDDVQVTNRPCSILPTNANPNKPTATPVPTTSRFTLPPTIPPSPYNCDFEKDICSYTQTVKSDVFNWTRTQGDTYSSGTGPLYDHTIQQGVVLSDNGPGSLQHALSGKCLHINGGAFTKPKTGTNVVYYDGCGQLRLEFQFTKTKLWKHTKFGMCIARRGGSGSKADDVIITDTCTDTWTFTSKGSMKHIGTGKCTMPFRGYSNPPNNIKMVLSTTCDDVSNKQKMKWSPCKCDYLLYFRESRAAFRGNGRNFSSNRVFAPSRAITEGN